MSEPWTPERIIEAQRETIARLTRRVQSAERMRDALALHAGRLQERNKILHAIADAAVETLNQETETGYVPPPPERDNRYPIIYPDPP